MKILLISQYFHPENTPANELARLLVSRGYEVTVLTGLPNYPQGKFYPGYKRLLPFREIWNQVNVVRVPVIPRGNSSNVNLILNYLSFAITSSLAAPFLCKEKYEIMIVFQTSPITQALAAVVLKKIRKIPLYLWVQDLWPESMSATGKVNSSLALKAAGALVKFIYKNCDKILIQSRSFTTSVQQQRGDAKKIFYFPNFAGDLYRPLSLWGKTNAFSLPEGFLVLYAGNIGSAQSIFTILEAAEKNRHSFVRWLIAGDGSERKNLQIEIEKRKLQQHVFWIGSYPVEEMPYLFSAVHVLLLTLKKDAIFSMTIPSKLQSYLAAGKPVITVADGETMQVVEEAKAGFAVNSEDAEQLAKSVLAMQNMTAQELEIMGMNGYEYFNKYFSQDVFMKNFEALH